MIGRALLFLVIAIGILLALREQQLPMAITPTGDLVESSAEAVLGAS